MMPGRVHCGKRSRTLTLDLCILSNNVSSAQGGAIASAGALGLTNCTLVRNRGFNDGGAIFQTNGVLRVTKCTLSHNTNTIRGGAITINTEATAVFNGTTFCSNSATFGGALMLYSTVKITNCTIAGNFAVFGGAKITLALPRPPFATRSLLAIRHPPMAGIATALSSPAVSP